MDIDPGAEKYLRGPGNRFVGESLGASTSAFDRAMHELGAEEIDLAFIDGDHRCEAALADFAVLEARASKTVIIAFHDTWPRDAEQAQDYYCADSFRVPEVIREHYADVWRCITIPIHPGLTLCSRVGIQPHWRDQVIARDLAP